jgi:hypothetical protein
VGDIDLKRGSFFLADENRSVDGLQMKVTVLGKTTTHESEGYQVRHLPALPGDDHAAFNQFLAFPEVNAALAKFDVSFKNQLPRVVEAAKPAVEKPYWACNYSWPVGVTSCSEGYEWSNYGLDCVTDNPETGCGTNYVAYWRKCGVGYDNPCGNEGPGGCARCWSEPYSSTCSTSAYSGDGVCHGNGSDYPFYGTFPTLTHD